MKDSPSYSSGRFSSSNVSSVSNAVVNVDGHDEFEILPPQIPLAASSVYSKKSQSVTSKRSKASKSSKSVTSKRSKASKSSKGSKKSATNDKRDDYSGRFSRTSALDDREDDAIVSLPASMKSTSVSSQRSKTASTRSGATPLPQDFDTSSRTTTSTRSRKSSSSSKSGKSRKSHSTSASIANQDDVEELSALSVQQTIAMLHGDDSGANQDAPSVTESMASKRKQLKAKEIEIEERRMALMEAEQLNARREREISEKLTALRRKGEEEAASRMHSLKALELQLNEKMRVLEVKEKEYGLEISSKFKAIDEASIARRKKEKKLEADMIDFARKEQEINERLAAVDAASVARRKKEKKLETDMIDFAQKTLEINERLAAIDAASVARKKKEKKLEAEIAVFAQKEKEINERKAAIDAASVARKKKEKELDEQIKVFARKEKIINDRLAAVEASVLRSQHSCLESVDTGALEQEHGCLGNKKKGFGSRLKSLFQKKKTFEA